MIIRGFSDHFLLTRGKVFTASIIEAFTTKLKAYGLSLLKREYDYLLNRGQVTKVGFSYSSSMNILSRVLQGSILGSLLFKFFYVTCFLESENFFFKLCRWYYTLCCWGKCWRSDHRITWLSDNQMNAIMVNVI